MKWIQSPSYRRCLLTLSLGILLLGMAARTTRAEDPGPKPPSSPVLQLELVPDDAMAGVVVRPIGFFTDPELKVVEGILATVPFRFPLPVVDIEQIAFVAEQRKEGLLKNDSTLIFDLNIFQFRRPVTIEQMLGEGSIPSERKLRKEIAYENLTGSYNIAVWRIDQHRAIVAPNDTIERAIDRGPIQASDSKTKLQKSLPVIGGSQMIIFIRCDVLSEQLKPFLKMPGATGVMARTMTGLSESAEHVVIGIERASEGEVRIRFAVTCLDETQANKKKRMLGALLVMFKQFIAQRKTIRVANNDSLGDRKILANDAEKLFERSSIDVTGNAALITLRADVAVGNVIGLFSNAFGSVIGQNFTSVSANFDEATSVAAQPKAAVPAGVMRASLDSKQRSAALRRMTLWSKGLSKYRETHGALPALTTNGSDGTPLLSWRVAILPAMGHEELYAQFHLNEAWDSPHNRSLVDQIPEELKSTYPIAVLDDNGNWNEQVRPELGRAVWFAESNSEQPWTAPGDIRFSEIQKQARIHSAGILMAGPPGQAFFDPHREPPSADAKK